MKTNTDITLFHKNNGGWAKYHIDNANWQEKKSLSIDNGYKKDNQLKLWIPYDKNPILSTIPFNLGDIIVKGNHADITKIGDINGDNYNILVLQNVNDKSNHINHIYIEG